MSRSLNLLGIKAIPDSMRGIFHDFFLSIVLVGSLVITTRFSDPGALKSPLILLGLLGLGLSAPGSFILRAPMVPFWVYAFFGYATLTGYTPRHAAALTLFLTAFAFMLGYSRSAFMSHRLVLATVFLCLIRGLWDYVSATNLGNAAENTVTAFFAHKNIYGFLLVGVFYYHLFLLESKKWGFGGRNVFLWLSLGLTILTLILSDSRGAEGGLLISFVLYLLIGFRKAHEKTGPFQTSPTRLFLVAAGALALFATIELLPEKQVERIVDVFIPDASHPGWRQWVWKAGWRLFLENPWLGSGTGGFAYAVIPHELVWTRYPINPTLLMGQAHNHFLQVLCEKGAIGFVLETILLVTALVFLKRAHAQNQDLPAKYAFFTLLGIAVHSFVAEASEYPTSQLVYWALIGYGWSFVPRQELAYTPKRLWIGIGMAAIILPLVYHLAAYGKELVADFHFTQAQKIAATDSKKYVDEVAKALTINNRHPDANSAYAAILASYSRYDQALERMEYGFQRAPNLKPLWILKFQIFFAQGRYDSAYAYAVSIQSRFPYYLPALSTMMMSQSRLGNCKELDSLKEMVKSRVRMMYPKIKPNELTVEKFNRDFQSDPHWSFLQKRINAESLRKKYFLKLQTDGRENLENSLAVDSLLSIACSPHGTREPSQNSRK